MNNNMAPLRNKYTLSTSLLSTQNTAIPSSCCSGEGEVGKGRYGEIKMEMILKILFSVRRVRM